MAVPAHAQGFAPESSQGNRPAYDEVIQAVSGLVSLQDRAGDSLQFMPTFIADKTAALYLLNGILAALDLTTHNGNLRAGIVGRVKVRGYNGNNTIEAVQEWADLETYNGDNEIASYGGGAAQLVTYNGDIRLTASRAASGRIEARTYNGDIHLRGVADRSELDVTTKTRNGHVSKH